MINEEHQKKQNKHQIREEKNNAKEG